MFCEIDINMESIKFQYFQVVFLEININIELNWISIFSSGLMSWLLLVGCLSGAGVASRPKWDITKIGSPRKLHFFVITFQQCPWHSKSMENSQVYHVLCHHRIFYDDTKRNLLSEFWHSLTKLSPTNHQQKN